MSEKEIAVQIRGLTRQFGDVRAVEALTFGVNAGELFGLVGPDGAGKTTTLRMLAGILRPSAGDAIIHGASVVEKPERVKREIAYMSQRFGLYADLTVMENLDFYADIYQVPKAERVKRLKRLFEFSGLGPFRQRLAGQLSGGMKQKLGLSCALIHWPKVLLLDEPTFGVDPISRRDLWLIIHEMIAKGGVTAIVSTAYMDEAERFDRVALLHNGRLAAMDTPQTLQGEIGGELLMIRTEKAREAREHLERMRSARRVILFGDRLHAVVGSVERDGPVVKRALEQAGIAVTEIRRISPTMEDVFIYRVAPPKEATE